MAKDLRELSESRSTGLFGELWGFMSHNKKWWLTPILLMLLRNMGLKNHQKINHPTVNDMIIISIGTGIESKSYSFKKMEKAGKLGWVTPIIDILMSANAETVDYQLCQMFQTLGQRNQKNYYRLNPSLKNASPAMDNVRRSNIENLIQAGLSYIDDNRETLNQIVQKLIRNKI